MTGFVLYPLLCVACFYLGSQALITRWLWSRYPSKLDSFMSCPACSGFWYGGAWAAVGWWQHWSFAGLDPQHWLTVVMIALASLVWTPLLSRLHTMSMTWSDE